MQGGDAQGPIDAVHEGRRAAVALRGAHAASSVGLLGASAFAVLSSDGAARRAAWDGCAELLFAHGLVAAILVPVLLLATARLRRGTPLAVRRVVVARGRLRLVLAGDEALDVALSDVAIAAVTARRDGRTRVSVTLGRGLVRDRLHLDLAPGDATALVARVRGPRSVDPGLRTLETAGWTVTLSYAAAWIAALIVTPLLRDVVPLAPGEPGAAVEHAGWVLGIGVAAFWITHAALAWATAPRARLMVGADGVQVVTLRRRETIAFADLAAVERRRRGLRLHRADGTRVDVPLGLVPARAIDAAAAELRAADHAAGRLRAGTEGPPPASAADVRAHAARLATDGYRVEPLPDELLASAISAPRVHRGARVGAALALASRGEDGRRAVRARAAAMVDEETRRVLEAIAEGEVDDGAIERVVAQRPASA